MPVRWDHTSDHILLTKILEVNPDIKVNAAAVAEAWRKLNDLQKLSLLLTSQLGTAANEGEAKPTPRAIAERLARIRQLIRGKHGDGPGKKGSISLKPSSTNGVAPKARNAPITGTSAPLKNKFQAKPVKTEGNEEVSLTNIDDANDGDNESDDTMPFPSAQRSPPPFSTPSSKVITSSTGLPTPKTERKKSVTPNRRPVRHEDTPEETDSESLTDLSTILKGGSKRMQTRGKRVTKYDSDEGQKDSEVSEFGAEKD